MSEYYYKLNEKNIYEFYDDNNELLFKTEKVSILFDKDDNVLLKHGKPEIVNKYYKTFKFKCEKSNSEMLKEFLKSLVVIEGRFDIEELNKCISICDYIGRFYDKIKD